MKTFSFVWQHVNRRSLSLSKFQEFVLVLIKLRLAVPHQDLAYRFNVLRPVVSRRRRILLTKTLLIVLMFQDLLFHVFSIPG